MEKNKPLSGLRTESGRAIEEAANSELLVTPEGSTALGRIDANVAAAIGSAKGEIQANVGALRHAEQRHGRQICDAGYADVYSFLFDVVNNWTDIREGNNGALWLIRPVENRYNDIAVVKRFSGKESVFRVATLMHVREDSLKNKKLLFAGRPTPAISPGADVNLARATPFTSGEYAAKGDLSEEQPLND